MTTLMSSTNAQLPKISYIKSIDVFLGTCFVMVFGSLLEYAVVGYLGKRISMRKQRYENYNKSHEEHRKKCHAAAAAHAAFGAAEHLQPQTDSGGSQQASGASTGNQPHHQTPNLAQNQPPPAATQLQHHLHHIHAQPIQPQLICPTTGLLVDPSNQMTCGLKTPVRIDSSLARWILAGLALI